MPLPIVRGVKLQRRTLAAVFGCVLLAGCGGAPAVQTSGAAPTSPPSGAPAGASTSAAAGASGSGACSLATAADATAAYGEAFEAGQPSSPGGLSSCLFKQSGGGIDTVNLTLAAGPQADVTYSSNRSVYDATDVTGFGDKAFISNDGGMMGVQRGSSTLLAHVVGFEKDSPPQLQAKQKAFLETVLKHAS